MFPRKARHSVMIRIIEKRDKTPSVLMLHYVSYWSDIMGGTFNINFFRFIKIRGKKDGKRKRTMRIIIIYFRLSFQNIPQSSFITIPGHNTTKNSNLNSIILQWHNHLDNMHAPHANKQALQAGR